MSEEKKNISVSVSIPFFEALEDYCRRVNMSKSSLIKKAVGDILISKGYLKIGGSTK